MAAYFILSLEGVEIMIKGILAVMTMYSQVEN